MVCCVPPCFWVLWPTLFLKGRPHLGEMVLSHGSCGYSNAINPPSSSHHDFYGDFNHQRWFMTLLYPHYYPRESLDSICQSFCVTCWQHPLRCSFMFQCLFQNCQWDNNRVPQLTFICSQWFHQNNFHTSVSAHAKSE